MTTNPQVAHMWAAYNMGTSDKNSARSSNGNFHYAGASLYSYQTEIARFITTTADRYVLCDTYGYSPSTVGKHYNARWCALHGLGVRTIDVEGGRLGREFDWTPQQLIEGRLAQAEALRAKALKRRKYAGVDLEAAWTAIKDARFLATAHGIPFDNAEDFIARLTREREGLVAWANVGKFFGDYWRAAEQTFDAPLRALGDIAAGLSFLASVGMDRHYGSRANHIYREYPRELPTLLRVVNGDTVETSRGAEFPLADGLSALSWIDFAKRHPDAQARVMARGTEILAPRLGHFRIDAVDANGTVRAGCHTVPEFAVRWAARVAGAIDAPELDHVAYAIEATRFFCLNASQ